jgi:Domain of unknown function (DUF4189)
MYVKKYLAVGVPSVLVALGVALAPPAGAWIAMADSPWWNHGVYWIERSNQADAEAAALAACRQSGTSRDDCRIMASGPTCAAVSADPDGVDWHGGSGSTRPAAEAAALAPPAEPGAHIVASHCNGD